MWPQDVNDVMHQKRGLRFEKKAVSWVPASERESWVVTLPPRPPCYINFFEPFHFLAVDQLVVPIGASHISLRLQGIQSREREEREQTNNMPWVNPKCKTRSYATLCISLAWISSETSTKLQGKPTYPDRFSSPHANSSLCCPVSSALSVVRRQLPSSSPFFSLSDWRSLSPLPVTPRSRVQNPLSGFAPKQTKESSAWRTSYIVLQSFCLRRRLTFACSPRPCGGCRTWWRGRWKSQHRKMVSLSLCRKTF